jgi:hypothetical protein
MPTNGQTGFVGKVRSLELRKNGVHPERTGGKGE